MAWILGLDTSSMQLDIGLANENGPVCAYSRFVQGTHAEHICESVDFLLKSSKISPSDITHAAVTVGPGSFTGLRIGIAFIKGFFLTRNVSILPVSSLESIALGWRGPDSDIMVVLDARQGQVFRARFKREHGVCRRLEDDALVTITTLKSELRQGDIILADTLGYRKSALLTELSGSTPVIPVQENPVSRGLSIAMRARELLDCATDTWVTPVDILPRYLQQSAAEIRHGSPVIEG